MRAKRKAGRCNVRLRANGDECKWRMWPLPNTAEIVGKGLVNRESGNGEAGVAESDDAGKAIRFGQPCFLGSRHSASWAFPCLPAGWRGLAPSRILPGRLRLARPGLQCQAQQRARAVPRRVDKCGQVWTAKKLPFVRISFSVRV